MLSDVNIYCPFFICRKCWFYQCSRLFVLLWQVVFCCVGNVFHRMAAFIYCCIPCFTVPGFAAAPLRTFKIQGVLLYIPCPFPWLYGRFTTSVFPEVCRLYEKIRLFWSFPAKITVACYPAASCYSI